MRFDLRAHTILLTVHGSRAYGTHSAQSDVDVRGVAIAPLDTRLGFLHRFEQADDSDEVAVFLGDMSAEERAIIRREKLEGSIYSLVKFCRLAADCNPNILDALFCREREIRMITPWGRRLREARSRFLSCKARHTFSGYARSQLERIERHRRWLLEPPAAAPSRADYDLPERTLIPRDQLAAARSAVRKRMDSWQIDFGALEPGEVLHIQEQIESYLSELWATRDGRWRGAARAIGLEENFIALLDRERRYRAARREWRQYQSWKQKRNPARAAIEMEFGYDCKHAMHLIRLLRAGREILTEGCYNVWRGDRDREELLEIRAGGWSYERLVETARQEDAALKGIYARGEAVVPEAPDREALSALCTELILDFHGLGGARER